MGFHWSVYDFVLGFRVFFFERLFSVLQESGTSGSGFRV